MPKTSLMKVQVNNYTLNWDEDTDRVARPCLSCKKPTTGRSSRKSLCLDCALVNAFKPLTNQHSNVAH